MQFVRVKCSVCGTMLEADTTKETVLCNRCGRINTINKMPWDSYAVNNNTYDMNYDLVDLADYVTNELVEYQPKIYDLIDEVDETNSYTFHMNDGLVTGTYKLEFRLYDGTSYVGNITRYIIIK